MHVPVVRSCLQDSVGSALPMANNARRWLTKAIRSLLIPEFERRGFVVVPLDADDAQSREIRAAFPFGHLRRSSPSGYDLVEIQLGKYGAAEMRLNVGVAPVEGIEHALTGHIEQEDVRVGYLDRSFELYRYPRFRRWFSVRRWPWQDISEQHYIELVRYVVTLIPEVEDALKVGKIGPPFGWSTQQKNETFVRITVDCGHWHFFT